MRSLEHRIRKHVFRFVHFCVYHQECVAQLPVIPALATLYPIPLMFGVHQRKERRIWNLLTLIICYF